MTIGSYFEKIGLCAKESIWDQVQIHQLFGELISEHSKFLENKIEYSYRDYTRTIIYEDGSCELVLLGWLKGQEAPPHDHGDSNCYLEVISGELSESTFKLNNERSLRIISTDTLIENDFSISTTNQEIHSLSCKTEKAMSLHLYGPSLKDINFY